jgi:pimeloyl-ACP methyl ester carboxylesterase
MAARFWRLILSAALALAAASGAVLSRAFSLPVSAAPALALGMLLAMPVALVLLSGVIAQAAADDRRARRSARNVAHALLGEIAEFTLAVLAMSASAGPQQPAQGRPAARAARPVLLLHGILCNHRVWRVLQKRLHTAGFGPIEALDVEPLLVDIEVHASRVAPHLLALQSRCSGERVVIIAHSMGGLIARTLLRDLGAGVIRRIVTIASPHHGTALVRGLPWPNTRQMSRVSPWLRTLNAAQEGRFTVPISSIYSLEDNLVAPAGSARLQGAELHEVRGVGHFGTLRSQGVLDCVIATLSQEYPT